ncbi:MAG: hypothetical protein C4531_02810 [Desulfurivibrio sp.]|nr:MAG: hypothetical protein C4531_02810 [Desulfurivibrio sp.]
MLSEYICLVMHFADAIRFADKCVSPFFIAKDFRFIALDATLEVFYEIEFIQYVTVFLVFHQYVSINSN